MNKIYSKPQCVSVWEEALTDGSCVYDVKVWDSVEGWITFQHAISQANALAAADLISKARDVAQGVG